MDQRLKRCCVESTILGQPFAWESSIGGNLPCLWYRWCWPDRFRLGSRLNADSSKWHQKNAMLRRFIVRANVKRSIVLIHGFRPAFWGDRAKKATLYSWQRNDSSLVRCLQEKGDVYAYCYAQDVTVEECVTPCLVNGVRQLKKLGYTEIVLVGHSAGGLIARLFVEDYPQSGVTKVVQVSAPNRGTQLAGGKWMVADSQKPFLRSLTEEYRHAVQKRREGKRIPQHIQFVCLVGVLGVSVDLTLPTWLGKGERTLSLRAGVRSDGVVPCHSQWPAELQAQGIPAVVLDIDHYRVVRTRRGIERIVDLVCSPQQRWSARRVAAELPAVLGTKTLPATSSNQDGKADNN
ncbi:MAG: hypothetical protein KatS3mg105_2252 [Gemmatales bacterium]|nr:MAG: hypothetical protein KatS3mg105_2252 [Gemmatales bacterium]